MKIYVAVLFVWFSSLAYAGKCRECVQGIGGFRGHTLKAPILSFDIQILRDVQGWEFNSVEHHFGCSPNEKSWIRYCRKSAVLG